MRKLFFDAEERSVKMPRKTVPRVVSLLIAIVLFSVPLSVQPCQMSEVSKNPCCCCSDSPDFSQGNHRERQECGCHMGEKHQEENSPAVIASHHDSKPEAFPVGSEAEVIRKDHFSQLAGLYPHPLSPASKDPPLYLLHSSFLI